MGTTALALGLLIIFVASPLVAHFGEYETAFKVWTVGVLATLAGCGLTLFSLMSVPT